MIINAGFDPGSSRFRILARLSMLPRYECRDTSRSNGSIAARSALEEATGRSPRPAHFVEPRPVSCAQNMNFKQIWNMIY